MEPIAEIPVVALLEVLIWPVTALIAIFILKKPIAKIIKLFSSADEVSMSIGSLSVQAKAMKEIHDSIGLGFQNSTLRKAEVEALIDTKIRSIQAAIEYELTKSEIRSDVRAVKSQKIIITDEHGEEFGGETLDISEAGVGFKSDGRLQFQEIVQIRPYGDQETSVSSLLPLLKIVRIEQSKEGFYYGATVPSAKVMSSSFQGARTQEACN